MAGNKRLWIGVGSALTLSIGAAAYSVSSPAATAGPPGITINSSLPADLNPGSGGAPNASLQQAAAFAWQEFIALNWPAAVDSSGKVVRETPATDCLFGTGKGAPDCATRPLTWETTLGKVEIYGPGALKRGYPNVPSYLYTTPITAPASVPVTAPVVAPVSASPSTPIPACDSSAPVSQPAWVNLDETSEIGVDAMYAGGGPQGAIPTNMDQQLIRFAAKANMTEFTAAASAGHAPSSSSPITLNNGTVELKAAWRPLTAAEAGSGRFHMAKVRYYENTGQTVAIGMTAMPQVCWREANWGLVGLHIIQKTPTAPYFIYATFEQADNILNPAGQPIEDADGLPSGNAFPFGNTNPATTIVDGPNPPATPGGPGVTLAGSASCQAGAGGRPTNQLYYRNSIDTLDNKIVPVAPTGGPICINQRDHAIPPEVVAANQQAHQAIAAYSKINGVSSPWGYYKLVNVQFKPLTKTTPGQRYNGSDVATYYMANSVIETNTVLQNFSGGFAAHTNVGSDFARNVITKRPPTPPATAIYYNVQVPAVGPSATLYDMGGCMGCHGNAQAAGGDFSFILLGLGDPIYPDAVPVYTPAGLSTRAIRAASHGTPRQTALAQPRAPALRRR